MIPYVKFQREQAAFLLRVALERRIHGHPITWNVAEDYLHEAKRRTRIAMVGRPLMPHDLIRDIPFLTCLTGTSNLSGRLNNMFNSEYFNDLHVGDFLVRPKGFLLYRNFGKSCLTGLTEAIFVCRSARS